MSGRGSRPFVAVNCAALPEHLLESELFGHEKGAFTGAIARKLGKFELAHGGTILLDEISEMELSLQAKLLRVLQESELDRVGGSETVKVDVRVIATTNRDLAVWVEEGKFRQDLYFRLNVIPLTLPPLRERGNDVELLTRFFMDLYSKDYGIANVSLAPSALNWLKNYDWPGNVRELQNLMERAVLLCGGRPIEPGHFLLDPDNWPVFLDNADAAVPAEGQPSLESEGGSYESSAVDSAPLQDQAAVSDAVPLIGSANSELFSAGVIPLHEMERLMIIRGLEQTAGNRTQAADLLGISVRTLRNKLNEYRELGVEVF
jgi:transcriptional regulator with GAF, ATPase, and Fis domain